MTARRPQSTPTTAPPSGWQDLAPHPMANAFPMMGAEALDALIESIKTNGFNPRFPIVLHEGQVLDGRNRLAACRAADVEPVLDVLPDGEDPATFAWTANAERRHLTDAARVRARDLLFPPEDNKGGRPRKETLDHLIDAFASTVSTHPAHVGRELGISARTVSAVRKVGREGPPVLVEAMTAGQVSPHDARNALAFEEPEIEAAVRAKRRGETRTVAGWARRQRPAAAPSARKVVPRPDPRKLAEAATTMARARWAAR